MQTELEMAVSAVVADWSGARYVNGSNETLEDYMTKERVEANMNTADYNLKEFTLNTENGVIVGYKDKDYNFTVEITSSGNSAKVIYEGNGSGSSGGSDSGDEDIEDPDEENPGEEFPPVEEEESFADVVTEASHYGDYVDYTIDLNEDGNTTNDWRIFYNDGEHIFIIAADYVKNNSSYLNNVGTGMTANSTYNLYWASAPNTAQDTSQATLFGQTLWTDYSTNENGRCVSALLNTNNWTGFVDSTYGEYAIGGPTIEMWVNSYNSRGYTQLYCNNVNNSGYFVGNTNMPTTFFHDIIDDNNSGIGDTLYFPQYSGKSSYMWISSPSSSGNVMISSSSSNSSESIGNTNYNRNNVGIRPLVCLNSEVTAEYENGVWNLSVPNV